MDGKLKSVLLFTNSTHTCKVCACFVATIPSSWGQHGAHLGPVGPRWAPCWSMNPAISDGYWRLTIFQQFALAMHHWIWPDIYSSHCEYTMTLFYLYESHVPLTKDYDINSIIYIEYLAVKLVPVLEHQRDNIWFDIWQYLAKLSKHTWKIPVLTGHNDPICFRTHFQNVLCVLTTSLS